MLISIHDHTLKRVGFLSNDDSETPDFKDDNFHRYLAQGASTFDFTVNKIKNGVVQDYVQLLNERAYFSFQYEGEDFLFDSVIVEEDDDKITFNCLTLNLEMRNEEVKALKNTASHNIQWYFDQLGLINFAKISLGINQVKNDTRVINYDSEDTKLARLISVIQNFDAEFEFVTKLKRDGTLDNITLNIYKKNDGGDVQGVGQNRNDVLLSFGENVTGVNRKVEKSQIFNSLYVTGKDGLSWKNSSWSVTNSEGQEEFYKRAGESYAKAPLSAQMFPSQLKSSSGDIFTNKNVATEYTTVNAMWGYALSQLKQYAYPLITYEVTATSDLTVSSTGDGTPLHIGDTVRIQDKNFIDSDGNVGLFLSARVSELEISFTNPTSNKITFSNYIKLKSEVSDNLTARMQEIINANTPYRPDITSTNGLQFKNGTGTTTLGAHIYFGSDDKETIADSYEWSKDGTVVANAQTITVDASGVADKAVYSFKAIVAGKVVASQSVTITNVNDGTITHTAYAYSSDGTDRFTTVYPNLNLIEDGKFAKSISSKWNTDGTTISKDDITGYFKVKFNGAGSLNRTYYTAGISTITIGQKYSVYIKAYSLESSLNIKMGSVNTSQAVTVTNNSNIPKTYKVEGLVRGTSDTLGIFGGLTTTIGTLFISEIKLEQGSTSTPWMPSQQEVTTADYPNYIGQYTDFTQANSTNPSAYTWSLIRGNDGTNGKDGDPGKVVQQDTEPEERFKDMLWQYTGTVPLNVTGLTAQSNMTYVWNGEAWQIWFLNPANLQAVNAWITNAMIANAAIDFAKINSATIENLSAVNSILGDVRAGKITNEFEYESSAGKTKGTLVIDEIGLRMDYVENEDETKPGSLQVSPSGMTVSRYNTEGLRETASYTQKGMVMSSDVLPMKLSWQGITATVNYERSFNIVYITGGGNWGKFEANKERFFGSLPKSVWPQYEIASGASSMGGAQNMAVKITTDGRIGITSSVAKDNCYAGFSITYRAIPNVS
ncbi:hypothetical protein [Lactococcus garvieae]|uniref:hypothetical protein n=1 Tax=Lactococcus garvieae TaxID=1363 RepID=UPI001CE26371|nr:hypothetical protein [Lactococcus garvieae]